MTKRFKDIEVSADLGQVRLYTTDTDYEDYDSYELLNLVNVQDQRIQELKEENERLKSTLAFRSNQLALMESLIDDLGGVEMKRQNDGDFK